MQPKSKLWPLLLIVLLPLSVWGQERGYAVGVAKVNVTPDYPIRLSGYGDRRTVSEGTAQQIWAKALAIGSDQEKPVIWITVDNCGLSSAICNEVARRLRAKNRIARERIDFWSTRTHTGPVLGGVLP